ncbi:MAG: amidohydrolase family protein [Conexivisphaerales archaeon]
MSLLIKRCRTLEVKEEFDLLVESGKILISKEKINQKAEEEIDAEGNLVLPSFVEPHVHLDKAFLAEKLPEAKSMSEARKLVRDAKSRFTKEDVLKRAERCIRIAIMNGVTYIRTHIDIDGIVGLNSFEAVSELKKKYRDFITLQIVAFPQEGIFRDEAAYELLSAALDKGADAVGGLPEAELEREKGIRHIEKLAALASERKVPLDMHVDVQPYTNYIEHFISEVKRQNLQGHATADHLIALAYYDDNYAKEVINMLKNERINVISNPSTMMVSGAGAAPPIARGLTRIKELLASGINIAFGLDNIVDPYNPFGDFDPIRNAWLFAYGGQLNSEAEITKLLYMPTYSSSRILELKNYGLQEGCRADINILDSSSPREALRRGSKVRYVIRSGRIILSRREVLSSHLEI